MYVHEELSRHMAALKHSQNTIDSLKNKETNLTTLQTEKSEFNRRTSFLAQNSGVGTALGFQGHDFMASTISDRYGRIESARIGIYEFGSFDQVGSLTRACDELRQIWGQVRRSSLESRLRDSNWSKIKSNPYESESGLAQPKRTDILTRKHQTWARTTAVGRERGPMVSFIFFLLRFAEWWNVFCF